MTVDQKKIEQLLNLGLLAPSVHNVQPWKFAVEHNAITVLKDAAHSLKHGDPTGRQTLISLGALIETINAAAPGSGLRTTSMEFPQSEAVVAKMIFADAPSSNQDLKKAIEDRFSDRSLYESSPISPSLLGKITAAWHSDDVEVVVSRDRGLIELVADLTAKGMGMAMSNPDFRNELAGLILPPTSRQRRGISTASLNLSGIAAYLEPITMRLGLGGKARVQHELAALQSANALVLTFTQGDVAKYWLQAGRAYARTYLEAVRLGLRGATTAAVVEVPDFHLEVEKKVGTKKRLQTVLRIGYSHSPIRHSPRVPLEQVLVK